MVWSHEQSRYSLCHDFPMQWGGTYLIIWVSVLTPCRLMAHPLLFWDGFAIPSQPKGTPGKFGKFVNLCSYPNKWLSSLYHLFVLLFSFRFFFLSFPRVCLCSLVRISTILTKLLFDPPFSFPRECRGRWPPWLILLSPWLYTCPSLITRPTQGGSPYLIIFGNCWC